VLRGPLTSYGHADNIYQNMYTNFKLLLIFNI
jgi:hypothetical protein